MKELRVILFTKEDDNKFLQDWTIQPGKVYKIGRNPDKTEITVIEGTISRIHAELEYTNDGKLLLKDLGSANGTYLEGDQLKSQKIYNVKVNEKINLGDSKKFLQINDLEGKPDETKIENQKDEKAGKINSTRDRKESKSGSKSPDPDSKMRRDKRRSKEKNYTRKRSSEKEKQTRDVKDKYKKKEDKLEDKHGKRDDKYYHKKPASKSKSRSRSRRDDTSRRRDDKEDKSKIKTKNNEENKNQQKNDNAQINTNRETVKDTNNLKNFYKPSIDISLSDENLVKEELSHPKKYYEEFIKLKETQDSHVIKQKLPKLIEKSKENNHANNFNKSNQLKEDTQISGLKHEKEDYINKANKRPYKVDGKHSRYGNQRENFEKSKSYYQNKKSNAY